MGFRRSIVSPGGALLVFVSVLGVSGPASAAPRRFENDGNHTRVRFEASTPLFEVDGWFDRYNLQISGDPKTLKNVKVRVSIDAASINTNNAKRDKHLRSADFFDVQKHPKIVFTSTKASRRGDKIVVSGTLTMRGVEKPLEIPFTRVTARNGAGVMQTVFRGDFELDRNRWGIGSKSVAAKIGLNDAVRVKLVIAGFFKAAKGANR